MARLSKRVKKLEHTPQPGQPRLLHVMPGETEADAKAAHEREHGPIPPDTAVIVIQHTFRSAI